MASVQRIDNPASHTHGWQARAHVVSNRYVSRFFADKAHGGRRRARALADAARQELEMVARRRRMAAERREARK